MRVIASILKHFFSEVPQDVSRAPRIPLYLASDVVLPIPVMGRNKEDPALKQDVLDNLLQLLFFFSERQESTMVLCQDYSLALDQDRLFVLSLSHSKIPAKWQ
jgi:hypothetical protein